MLKHSGAFPGHSFTSRVPALLRCVGFPPGTNKCPWAVSTVVDVLLLRLPDNLQCRDRIGVVFLALVHFRYEFRDDGNFAAFGLSMMPLPQSDYIQRVDQPLAASDGHGSGGGSAAASPPVQPQPGGPSSPRLPLPPPPRFVGSGNSGDRGAWGPVTTAVTAALRGVSSASCSVPSSSGVVTAVAPSVSRQPLPPLDLEVIQRRAGSLGGHGGGGGDSNHSWGGGGHENAGESALQADMGGQVGLDDSFDSSRESMSSMMFQMHGGVGGSDGGGGAGAGFPPMGDVGMGGLEPRSNGGGVSSGWMGASSRAEMRMMGGL